MTQQRYTPTTIPTPPSSHALCQLLWLAAVRFVIDGLDTAKDYANPNDLCPTASVQNCEIMENWQHWTQWDKRRHLSSSSCLMKTCVGHKTIIMIYIPASSSIWLQIERDQFALSTRVCLCVSVCVCAKYFNYDINDNSGVFTSRRRQTELKCDMGGN